MTGLESSHSFNVRGLDLGTYYIYAMISDGVNPPYYAYMPEPFEVVKRPPQITVMDPDNRSGGTPADQVYYITWTDDDPDDDAMISLFYDNDDNAANGFLGTIVEGLSEDSPVNFYRWDTSRVPQGTYRIYARIEDSQGNVSGSYSPGVVVIEHDTPPVVQVLSPHSERYTVDKSYTIEWLADDLYSATGVVSLWMDTDNRNYNGTAIVQDLPLRKGVVDSYVWDTSLVPEREYWIYVLVDDGVNPPSGAYGMGSVWVNHPPVIGFTAPVGLGESPVPTGFTGSPGMAEMPVEQRWIFTMTRMPPALTAS